MTRYWVRWLSCFQDDSDDRSPGLLGVWCSGYRCADDGGDIPVWVALIEAHDEASAWAIARAWSQNDPDFEESFCDAKPEGWTPGDRFPMSEGGGDE